MTGPFVPMPLPSPASSDPAATAPAPIFRAFPPPPCPAQARCLPCLGRVVLAACPLPGRGGRGGAACRIGPLQPEVLAGC